MDEPVSFLGRRLGSSFVSATVTIAPRCARPYDEAEWAGALVVVERGAVELEGRAGGRRRFTTGAVLFLTGLGLRTLHNCGSEPVVLVAVTRRRPAAGSAD
jgi:hypothetical protein